MDSRLQFLTMMFAGSAIALAQSEDALALARLLASDATRSSAVAKVAASKDSTLPLLLKWARNPPKEVDKCQLFIGLADTFARLKTTSALPFLIKNLSLRRTSPADLAPWLKTADVIEDRFPTAAALIAMGPEACVH